MNMWAMYISIAILIGIYTIVVMFKIEKLKDRLGTLGISWECTHSLMYKLSDRVVVLESLIKTSSNDREINTSRIQILEDTINKDKSIKAEELADEIMQWNQYSRTSLIKYIKDNL